MASFKWDALTLADPRLTSNAHVKSIRAAMVFSPEMMAAPETERYDVQAVLGRGASSIVYKALDRQMNMLIALKSLRFVEEEDIYELKKEFRFFRDIYHRNLVQLFDLHIGEEACFFTMEMVQGGDFVSRFAGLRDGTADPDAGYQDLRDCLHQFTVGLAALHDAGRLHRDIKPSNVLIEAGGRTVLLDFGLSAEAGAGDSLLTQHRVHAGTPGYMAPERLGGQPASQASDVYGFGVVLYEALTGLNPFPGEAPALIYQAQATPPPPPAEVVAGVPEDLSELALLLLAFQPQDRADLKHAAAVTMQDKRGNVVDLQDWRPSLRHGYFVGRTAETNQFQEALAYSRQKATAVVTVSGPSGIGKSTLVERLVEDARDTQGALILRSRCHPQEYVQNKAIDGLVDALSRYLVLQSEDHLRRLCPKTLPSLISLFPVLGRVSFPYDIFDSDDIYSDPLEIIDRATEALAEILSRIGEVRPTVLWIDDLQWSDQASFKFMERIVSQTFVRNVTVILSFRDQDLEQKPDSVASRFLSTLQAYDGRNPALRIWNLHLNPLNADETGQLVGLIGGGQPDSQTAGNDDLVSQTDGLPYLIAEYAHHLSKTASRTTDQEDNRKDQPPVQIADLLGHRLAALTPGQTALLELVSVSAAPVSEALLVRLAGAENATGKEIYELIHLLMLRKGASEDQPMIEAYHDRIRREVLDKMPEDKQRSRHLQIAAGMQDEPDPDLGQMIGHLLDGGDRKSAATHALNAARQERDRYSYDDAVRYFALALEGRDWEDKRQGLVVEHADALAAAGRSAEAAEQYIEAAGMLSDTSGDAAAISLLWARAATKLLHSGQLRRGQEACRHVFEDLGIPYPNTLKEAQRVSVRNRLISIMAGALAPLRKPRNADVRKERATTLWEAAAGLLMLDFVVGDAVFSWFLRTVAQTDDPLERLRADSCSASGLANLNSGLAQKKSASLIANCERVAARDGSPHAQMHVLAGKSGVAWFTGRWKDAAEISAEGIELCRREVAEYDFVKSILRSYRLSAMVCMGELVATTPELRRAISDGERRGDRFITTLFPTGFGAMRDLAKDDPDSALRKADMVMREAREDHFTSLHWSYFNGRANALIYSEDHDALWALMSDHWPLIEKTGFLRLQCIAAILRDIRGRAALKGLIARRAGHRFDGPDEAALERVVRDQAKQIARLRILPFSQAFAGSLRSSLSALNDDVPAAIREMEAARQGFAAADMKLHAAAADLHLDKLQKSGKAAMPRQVMESEKITDVDRFADMLSPGLRSLST